MARKKKHKSPPESVLESVFGIRLDADGAEGSGNAGGTGGTTTPPPHPQPEVDPADAPDPAAVEARADALAEKKERAVHRAVVRSAAVDVARAQGIKQQRAPSFVKLLDFSGVAMNSDGDPDEVEIARIVRAGADEYPEFQVGSSPYGSAP